MNLDLQVSFGDDCGAYGGCLVKIKDPTKTYLAHNHPRMLSEEFKVDGINLVRFQDKTRNFYLLLDGSAYLKYGTGEFVPILSPYNDTEWKDYQDYWNYDDPFRIKSTNSTVFGVIHIKDPVPSNVSVKILTLKAGNTTKTIYSNSHLVIFKKSNTSCQIDDIIAVPDSRSMEHTVTDTREVNFNVSDKSYLICLNY